MQYKLIINTIYILNTKMFQFFAIIVIIDNLKKKKDN